MADQGPHSEAIDRMRARLAGLFCPATASVADQLACLSDDLDGLDAAIRRTDQRWRLRIAAADAMTDAAIADLELAVFEARSHG